jgi:transcriptional regulator with XRE-family HTH domain
MDSPMDVLDPVFPLQVRAARALLGWTQKQLADRAGVSELFINRLERGDRLGHARKLADLRAALLEANVSFFASETEFGVSLKGDAAQQARQEWSVRRSKEA